MRVGVVESFQSVMESDDKQQSGPKLNGKGAGTKDEGGKIRKEGDDSVHPLFMESLPADFATNPSLAALASLIDDESDDKTEVKVPAIPKVGGGKVRHEKGRTKRRVDPYNGGQRSATKQQESKASVREAQLFLRMWKL